MLVSTHTVFPHTFRTLSIINPFDIFIFANLRVAKYLILIQVYSFNYEWS